MRMGVQAILKTVLTTEVDITYPNFFSGSSAQRIDTLGSSSLSRKIGRFLGQNLQQILAKAA